MPPSLRTLSALPVYFQPDIDGETIPDSIAREVRAVIVAAALEAVSLDSNDYGVHLIRQTVKAYPGMTWFRATLETLSDILAPYGYGEVRSMEAETPRSCRGKTVYDLNTGDSYRVTICYCDGRWYVAPPAYFLGD